jgi:hypothetical protein
MKTTFKNVFKFRAECKHDVKVFMELANFDFEILFFQSLKSLEMLGMADVVVRLETNESLEAVKEVFNRIPDSHVMLETIQPAASYTGERVVQS